jgi:uncharacterized protein
VEEPRRVHRPEAWTVLGKVVRVDSVEVLNESPGVAERPQRRGLNGTAEEAAVRRIRPIRGLRERIDLDHDVGDPDRLRRGTGPFDLGAGDGGTREGHRLSGGTERVVGQRGHHRRIDASREGDERRPTASDPCDDLGLTTTNGFHQGSLHHEWSGRSGGQLPFASRATSIATLEVGRPMQAVRDGARWMVRLDDGQDLFESLAEFARREDLRAAVVIAGIGMVRRATVGYWDGTQYQPHELTVPHEVVALHGSIARADGAPSIHLHMAAAGPDHRLVGGHLMRATVGVLQEIVLDTFPGRTFGRPLVESFGLRMLDLEPGSDV